MRDSHHLEGTSIRTAITESSMHVSNTKDAMSESVCADYAITLDNCSVIDDIIVAGTT